MQINTVKYAEALHCLVFCEQEFVLLYYKEQSLHISMTLTCLQVKQGLEMVKALFTDFFYNGFVFKVLYTRLKKS